MNIPLTQYLVPCLTEDARITTDYRASIPTVCPNNNTHTINPEGIIILNTIQSKTVTINENSNVTTGGYYRADQFELAISGGTGVTGFCDISYSYNVSGYSVTFLTSSDNIGDTFEFVSYPNTPAGAISSDLGTGGTSIIISSAPLLNPGFDITLTDGTNTNNLGFITSIDINTNTINFSNAAVNSYTSGANLLFTIPRYKGGKFINNHNVNLGFSKIGSAGLPAGKIVRLIYTNSNGNPKTINFVVELQY